LGKIVRFWGHTFPCTDGVKFGRLLHAKVSNMLIITYSQQFFAHMQWVD